MNQQRAIRSVREGFQRHDKVAVEMTPLSPEGEPEVGQGVKLQLNLLLPLQSADEPDEETDWLAMTGTVTEVLAPDFVVATVTPTTHLYPADFSGEWVVELLYEEGWDYPWKLGSLYPADPQPALPCGFSTDEGLGFRIGWLNSNARASLGGIWAAIGGRDVPLEFVPAALPTGDRTTTLWCVACKDEAGPAEIELLMRCSDAIVVDPEPSDLIQDLIEEIPEEPAVIKWDRGIAPDALTPMKHALRTLLHKVSGRG